MKYVYSGTPVNPENLKRGGLRGWWEWHIQKHSLFFKQVTTGLKRLKVGVYGVYGGGGIGISENTNLFRGLA